MQQLRQEDVEDAQSEDGDRKSRHTQTREDDQTKTTAKRTDKQRQAHNGRNKIETNKETENIEGGSKQTEKRNKKHNAGQKWRGEFEKV